MTGPTYSWYKWMVQNGYAADWAMFVEALKKRFGSDLYENPQESLKELKQDGSVAEYQAKFEALTTKVQGLSEQWLVSFFIAGLSDYLKGQLHLAKPVSYPEAVSIACLHEQNQLALKDSFKIPPSSYSANTNCTRYNSTPSYLVPAISHPNSSVLAPSNDMKLSKPTFSSTNLSTASTNSSTSTNTKPITRRFTAAELRESRMQGLCYYCNEKYNPTHNCRAQCLALLTMEDLNDLLPTASQDSNVEEESSPTMAEVSFNALIGEYHPMTL